MPLCLRARHFWSGGQTGEAKGQKGTQHVFGWVVAIWIHALTCQQKVLATAIHCSPLAFHPNGCARTARTNPVSLWDLEVLWNVQPSSRRFRRDRQMLSQRHEDTKEELFKTITKSLVWNLFQHILNLPTSCLCYFVRELENALPNPWRIGTDLRAFVPSCEALLIGGTNGGGKRTKRDTACVRMGSCNLNSCVDLSTKGVGDRNPLQPTGFPPKWVCTNSPNKSCVPLRSWGPLKRPAQFKAI